MYSPDNAEITRFSKPLTRQGADFFIVVRSLPYYLKTRPPYEYPFVNPGNFIYRRLVPRLLCLFGGKHHSYITYHRYHSDFAAHHNWQKAKLVIPAGLTLPSMDGDKLKRFLDSKVDEYNQPFFIKDDPVSIPHLFTKPQDIEIAGFFASILAWGNRKSIINSCRRLFDGMNNEPYRFILELNTKSAKDFAPFMKFAHRTFNSSDLFTFFNFLHYHFAIKKETTLETAFSQWMKPGDETTENALNGFYLYFFNEHIEFEKRTMKHIAAPFKKSACKRLNMFLRWMVRSDNRGVDFGLWKNISPAQLICPLDVHVARVARHFGLLREMKTDPIAIGWNAAIELTETLKTFDPVDPVKYDFALFALGSMEKHG